MLVVGETGREGRHNNGGDNRGTTGGEMGGMGLGRWHRVKVKRYHRDVQLTVDRQLVVIGRLVDIIDQDHCPPCENHHRNHSLVITYNVCIVVIMDHYQVVRWRRRTVWGNSSIGSMVIRIASRSKGSHKSLNVEPVMRLGSTLFGCIGGLKVSAVSSSW